MVVLNSTILYGLFLTHLVGMITGQNSVNERVQDACYCLEEVAGGIYSPTGALFVPGKAKGKTAADDATILLVEQRGVIRSVTGHKTDMFLDIRDRVFVTNDMGDSRGLLSAVLSPNYNTDNKVYVYYIREINKKQYSYVSQFHVVDGKADPATERFLLRVLQPFEHGNGGPMLFGDDGYLYIVIGDGGAQDDMDGYAQSKTSFYGSILRIDPTNGQDFTGDHSAVAKMYSVPDDNPFKNKTDAIDEMYAFGFRNPWGCSVDSKNVGGDGRIYCVETGTDQFDEVNVVEKGKNYGWHLKEGSKCLKNSSCGVIENEGLPVFEFEHVYRHALVGGYVYRGKHLSWMKNKGYYTFADVITGETYYLAENKTSHEWESHDWALCDVRKCPKHARDRPLRHVFGFAQDHHGELYMLMVNTIKAMSNDGKMFKVQPAESSSSSLKKPYLTQTISSCVLTMILVAYLQRQSKL